MRYPPDKKYISYLKKRMISLQKIKSEYVLFCDNDDFLLRNGIKKMLNYLENAKKNSLIQGRVGNVVEKKRYFIRADDWSPNLVVKTHKIKATIAGIENGTKLWYAIIPTKIQLKIIETLFAEKCENPFLCEQFQSYYCLANCNIIQDSCYYYVRQANPIESVAANSLKYWYPFFLDVETCKLLKKLAKSIKGPKYESLLFKKWRIGIINKFFKKPLRNDRTFLFKVFNKISYYCQKRSNNITYLFS